MEPPAQTPFYSCTRLLIECKDYRKKIGLNTIRSTLGLREDINHFDIVDVNRLLARRRQNRVGIVYPYERYTYQVAVASLSGFTVQAQEFAATHRIPLLEFDKMPFWSNLSQPWEMRSGNQVYLFQFPESIMKLWLENSTNDLELKKRLLIVRQVFYQV